MRILFLVLVMASQLVFAGDAKSKYGPKSAPKAISLAQDHQYFQSGKHKAPDFWALAGFYVPQFNGAACSVASMAMVLNAARALLPKTADDKVVLQQELLDKLADTEHWKARITSLTGYRGARGLSLDGLGKVAEAAFKAYGFPAVSVQVVHAENTPEAKKALIVALKKNEESATDFMLTNFNQQAFTDDADVGHIAPVAAYDAEKGRVLVMDPDREYYEPYWISVDTFLAGMSTGKDSESGKTRGYVVIHGSGI